MATTPITLTHQQSAAHVNPARIVPLDRWRVRFLCQECHTFLTEAQTEAHDCVLDCGLYKLPGR